MKAMTVVCVQSLEEEELFFSRSVQLCVDPDSLKWISDKNCLCRQGEREGNPASLCCRLENVKA